MNWRTDTPRAVDSPILVRGRTVGGAPCIMAWDDGTPPPGQPWHPHAKVPGMPCWRNTGLDRYGTDADLPVGYSSDELDAQILGYALEWLSLADVLGGGLLEELMELGYGQWRTEESPKLGDSPGAPNRVAAPARVPGRCMTAAVRCECDLLPAECLCARMREQVPLTCPLTWRVRHAWISWCEASMKATRCAMWLAGGIRSHGHYDRSRYADCIAHKRVAGRDLGQAIAYEIAREHPMDRAGREIDDGLHDVMRKLGAM